MMRIFFFCLPLDPHKVDILALCAKFRFVLGQKSAGFFGVAADFRMPAGIRHSS